jgi:hypothetical protein
MGNQVINNLEQVSSNQAQLLQQLVEDKIYTITEQMMHDITAPLMFLEVTANTCSGLPEEDRFCIRQAVSMIRGVADNLLNERKKPSIELCR